jgi:hypothetical protein
MHENSPRKQVFGRHRKSGGHLGAAKAVDQTFPRLWGKKERKNYGWYYFAIGFSLVTVLVVKAYVLHGIWTNWPF